MLAFIRYVTRYLESSQAASTIVNQFKMLYLAQVDGYNRSLMLFIVILKEVYSN